MSRGLLPQELLSLAEDLARSAAEFTLNGVTGLRDRKPDRSVVTETDLAIQSNLVQAIRGRYPDHMA